MVSMVGLVFSAKRKVAQVAECSLCWDLLEEASRLTDDFVVVDRGPWDSGWANGGTSLLRPSIEGLWTRLVIERES